MEVKTEDAVVAILDELKSAEYCLVKRSANLPCLAPGSDLDLYVRDLASVQAAVASRLVAFEQAGLTIRETPVSKYQCHVDLLQDDQILVRFDLYSAVPQFHSVSLKSEYFQQVLESRIISQVKDSSGKSVSIYVPSDAMEFVLRVCEYAEFYWTGPDKIHHVDFLLGSANLTREDGLRILHEVTEVPPVCGEYAAASPRLARGSLRDKVRFLSGELPGWVRSWLSTPALARLRESSAGSRLELAVRASRRPRV